MYGFIWRHLPGPLVLRSLVVAGLVAAVVAVLFVWVFPAVAPVLPFNSGTVSR